MHAAAAGSSARPPPPAAALLAPGFRFHPTDEELVSYYLRRRVCGRSLRVDAITEVDLYKCEPWDLPGFSRLRSRDLEWYFFSPLDRKHSNRCRTNRATAQGYWKTTGKDRPVRRGPRVVGMKKTLVYHSGRAPHGARTNWVMHEYRLEDDELVQSGITQDAYVVCRIFQKSGAGPQNGAQYGAPFIEEEWEEEEKAADVLVMRPDGGVDEMNETLDPEFLEVDDFLQNEDITNQQGRAATFLVDTDGQGSGSHPEDPSVLLDEMLKDPSLVDPDSVDNMVDFINQPYIQSFPTLADDSGELLLKELAHSPPIQHDGYLELHDFGNTINVDYLFSEGSVSHPSRPLHAPNFVHGKGESSNLNKELHDEEFVDLTNEIPDHQELLHMSPVENMLYLPPTDPLNALTGDCASHQRAEDLVFYDVSSDGLVFRQGSFTDQNEVLCASFADPPDLELDDDLMAYFDALDDDLQYDFISSSGSLKHDNPSILSHCNSEVDSGSACTNMEIPELPNTDVGGNSSSALSVTDNQFENKYKDIHVVPDVKENVENNKTIASRLVNMLGSISAPPAFAAEFPGSPGKSFGQTSETYQASPLHVSAGIVDVDGTEDWFLQKNGNAGLLLSYSIADNVGRKSSGYGPFRKIQDFTVSLLLRGGCYPFFLSALVLTIGYKVGMCIYGK